MSRRDKFTSFATFHFSNVSRCTKRAYVCAFEETYFADFGMCTELQVVTKTFFFLTLTTATTPQLNLCSALLFARLYRKVYTSLVQKNLKILLKTYVANLGSLWTQTI